MNTDDIKIGVFYKLNRNRRLAPFQMNFRYEVLSIGKEKTEVILVDSTNSFKYWVDNKKFNDIFELA